MKKKHSIIETAMHYYQIIILVVCCLIALGVYSLEKINKNEFPNFTIRQGVVVAVYPGATVDEIEQQVTKPLENYIFTYKEVKKEKTKSFSRNGMSIIQVELNDDFNDKDAFWSKFKHGVSGFKLSLPSGVLAVVVNDDFGDASALLITMESNDKTYRELNEYMNQLKDSLRTIESVGRLTVTGLQKEQISVYLDNEKLSHFGINDKTIAMNLFSKGFTTTAGSVKTEDSNSPIFVAKSMNLVSDVEQMIIYSDPAGNIVRLKDVAKVVKEYPELTSYVTNNGTKCIVLSIELKSGRSITEMGEEIDKKLTTFEQTIPQDVKLFKITDQAQVVGDSVVNFLKELLIAILAVVFVVILLMPLRVALVASSTIPITIFISLGLFYAFNIELNTVTLAALILTLGMIVDNSIVIIDSYVENLAEGKSRWYASIQSASHFFKSILSATLAISVTFFPFLVTLDGMFHDFILFFPWSISIVLFISLLIAELFVPYLQYVFITKPIQAKYDKNGEKKFSILDMMQSLYDKLIAACFRHPYITLSAGIASILVGILIFANLPQRLMPIAERNQFAVEIYLPTGTPISKTAQLADSIENILRQDDRIVSIASFKGGASPRFQTTYAPQFGGENYAQFIVNTKNAKATEEVLAQYRPIYENAFPEAYVKFKQLSYDDCEYTVEIRVSCEDLPKLVQTADTLTNILRANPKLSLVRNNLQEPLMTTKVKLDNNQASRFGISNFDLETTLALRYNDAGTTLATIWDNDYDLNIKLKSTKSSRNTLTDLGDEKIPVYGGIANIPLRQIADIQPEWDLGQICHRNGMRTVTVFADVKQGYNSMATFNEIIKNLKDFHAPDGVSIVYGGEYESSQSNMKTLTSALVIAVAIIFFILVIHYKSIKTSLILLCSLTLCVLGTALGILLTGVDFSLTCFLGIVSLMGILVRNGIIMYDYAEELQNREKMDVKEAIFTSAKRRMRPIFLTSAAASMGVIPMIIGQSPLWMPMGAVICVGTIVTMVLILTVLPVTYWLVNRNR